MAVSAPFPESIKLSPWEHQVKAFQFGVNSLDARGAFGLFSGMGTGKSAVVLALIAHYKPRSVLILAPKSMVEVWPRMFHAFHDDPDGHTVIALTGPIQKRLALMDLHTAQHRYGPLVFITNYEALAQKPMADALTKYPFDMVTLDESHKIKSPGGVISKRAALIGNRTAYRVALTGTPLHHSPMDVYGQYRFLDSNIFGPSFARFRNRYAVVINNGKFPQIIGYQNLDDLSERMYEIAYRVDGSVLSLPDKVIQDHYVAMEPTTYAMYHQFRKELILEIGTGVVTAANALVRLLRLQQITSGHLPMDDWETGEHFTKRIGTEKADALAEIMDGLPQAEPIVVFAKFRADLDIIADVARKQERRYLEISGKRNDYSRWRIDPGNNVYPGDVLGVQMQAGSAGIDLTRAAHAVYFSTGFSLGDYDQSVARLYRPGQNRTTYIHHLLCIDSVDEYIKRAIAEKADIARYVVDELVREGLR